MKLEQLCQSNPDKSDKNTNNRYKSIINYSITPFVDNGVFLFVSPYAGVPHSRFWTAMLCDGRGLS